MSTAAQFDDVGKLRRKCEECGEPVTHPVGPGRPRKYCDDECAAEGCARRKREWRDRLEAEERELCQRIARLKLVAVGAEAVP